MYHPKMNNILINTILTIIKLSNNGILNLKRRHISNLLKKVLTWYKVEISNLYDIGGYGEFNIKETPNIEFSLNPYVTDGYDPEENKLKFHLWTFFLSSTDDDRFPVCIEPIFKRASEFLHELDHYFFLKEHDKLCLSEGERVEFDKEYGQVLEKRAYKKMYDFYNSILIHLPEYYPMFFLNNDLIRAKLITPKKNYINTEQLINNIKKQVNVEIEKIDKGYEVYSKTAEQIAFDRVKNIADLFSFEIKIEENENDYERVEIDYWS